MSPDLERRLRDAAPRVEAPDPAATASVEERLLDRYAAPGPGKALRRLGWLTPGRAVAAAGVAGSLAAVAALVLVAPWSQDPDVRIDLGGSKDGRPEAPAAEEPPVVPFGAGDIPNMLKIMLQLPRGDQVEPGTLRRRVRIDRPEGTYQLWTYRRRGEADLGDIPVIVGKGYIQAVPIGRCDPLAPDSVPIAQCLGGLGTKGYAVGGRVLPDVAEVEIDAASGERSGQVGFGYWLGVSDAPRTAPFQIVARGAAGKVVARVPGRDPATQRFTPPFAPSASDPGPVVPDIVGVDLVEATRRLEALGFGVRRDSLADADRSVYEVRPAAGGPPRPARVGEVVRQSPPAGVAMARGRVVEISGIERSAQSVSYEGEIVAFDSPDVPPFLRELRRGSRGPMDVWPTDGTLRRHVSVHTDLGRYEIWTVRGKPGPDAARFGQPVAPGTEWETTITLGPEGTGAAMESGPITPASAPSDDGFALMQGGYGGGIVHGRVGREVASVTAVYPGGERPVTVGGGYWVVSHGEGDPAPLGLVARDAAGREVARLAGPALARLFNVPSLPRADAPQPVPDFPAGELVKVPAVVPNDPSKPDAAFLDPATAAARLEAAGFKVRIGSTDDTGLNGANRVLSQWPEAGSAMPAGRTVVLDIAAPAIAAPPELMSALAKAEPVAAAVEPLRSVPVRILFLGDDSPPPWIINALQNPGRRTMAVSIAGGTYLASDQAPAESFVLWTPGHEGEAAAIARRLGITRGASAQGLPASLFAVRPGMAPKGVTAATVLVVIGTRPLARP